MIVLETHRRDWFSDQSIEITGNSLTVNIADKSETFNFTSFTDGEYYLSDCLHLQYNPFSQIIVKEGKIFISVFLDDNFQNTFERKVNAILPIPTAENNLVMARSSQTRVIETSFKEQFTSGHFLSTAIGIEIDCRREGKDNDLQNVERLIKKMERSNIGTITYHGYIEDKDNVTSAMLETLTEEMDDFVLYNYNKKWMLESAIATAQTIEEVKNIIW